MAARANQPQAVVGIIHGLVAPVIRYHIVRYHSVVGELRLFVAASAFTADLIDNLAMSDSGNPGSRVLGNALFRPLVDGQCEGLLHALFRQVEGAGDADEAGDDAARLLAKD